MVGVVGEFFPLDSALPADGVGDYYATGAQVSPGVVVVAWTSGRQEGTAYYKARAVRWSPELTPDLGPLAFGPSIPMVDGFITEPRLAKVIKIAQDTAFIVPGDSVSEPDIIGWRIHVDPISLVISYLGDVRWPIDVSNNNFIVPTPGVDRSGCLINLGGGSSSYDTGFVSFNETGTVGHIETVNTADEPTDMFANVMAIVDLGDRFFILAKLLEDTVPDVGTVGHFGYQPGYVKMSGWIVPSIHGCPAPYGDKVMVFDEGPLDFDGVYATLLPNGHIHVFADRNSRYIYFGDPNTSGAVVFDINPGRWTYDSSPTLPYVGNGFAGGLQDYANIVPIENRPGTSMFSDFSNYTNGFPASDGFGGLRVGSFDGTNTVSVPIIAWESGLYRISSEVHSVGGNGFMVIANMDLGDVSGQVYAICGFLAKEGAISGAEDLNGANFF